MPTNSDPQIVTRPAPPEPFGAYVEAARTGDLLFLSGIRDRSTK
jgi:enamine deaminase RidA (YjgF/YER057c/UK114 family)